MLQYFGVFQPSSGIMMTNGHLISANVPTCSMQYVLLDIEILDVDKSLASAS